MFSRWLALSLLCVLFTPLLTRAADDAEKAAAPNQSEATSESSKPFAEQLAEIEKHIEDAQKKFAEERAGGNALTIGKALRTYTESLRKLADELKTATKANEKDPAVVDAILTLITKLRTPLDDDLVKIIADHHLDSAKLGQFTTVLSYQADSPAAEQLLKDIAAKSPHAEVRGPALFNLGDLYRRQATPYGKTVSEEVESQKLADAKKCFEQVLAKYSDQSGPDGKPLSEKVNAEMIRLTNIPNLKIGKPAPEITGEDVEGQALKLSDHRGKVVAVIFWGSWCGPCMAMVPHERELAERNKDKPFVMLGVNAGDDLQRAKETMKSNDMTWRSWWDGGAGGGPIQTAYNISYYPNIWVLDKDGVIRYRDVRGQQLDEAVDTLLAELEKPAEKAE